MTVNNKDLPLISVIVPFYNVEKYILQCASSLTKQTYRNLELIFVDDGSQDESMKKMQSIKDKRIKIVHQDNSGVSSARNVGLDLATGEYVVFVDADDYVANDYIEYLYNLITTNNADFAYSVNIFKSKTDKQIGKDKIRTVDGDESTGVLLSPDTVVGSWNKIYRRAVIEESKLRFETDLYYGEGLNYIIRMSLASKIVTIGARKVLFYRKNNDLSATTKYNNKKYHNGLKSLASIAQLINHKNGFVESMYQLHLSMFYLGAITQLIEHKKIERYKEDYKKWRKSLKTNVKFILSSNYVSKRRKLIIAVGAYCPHTVAFFDKQRRARIVKRSV